MSIPSVTELP